MRASQILDFLNVQYAPDTFETIDKYTHLSQDDVAKLRYIRRHRPRTKKGIK